MDTRFCGYDGGCLLRDTPAWRLGARGPGVIVWADDERSDAHDRDTHDDRAHYAGRGFARPGDGSRGGARLRRTQSPNDSEGAPGAPFL